jgi:hypothetical protein
MTAAEQLQQEIKSSGLSKREWYRTVYLYSDHWWELRTRKLNEAGRFCVSCDGEQNLQVHHKRYRSIFNVELSDLEVMCKKCHKAEHAYLKEERRKNYTPRSPKRRKKQEANDNRAIAKALKNRVFGEPIPSKSDLVSIQFHYWMAVATKRCDGSGDPRRLAEEMGFVIQKWGNRMSHLARKALKDTKKSIKLGCRISDTEEEPYVPELDDRLTNLTR